jgi:hypothetical protein
MRQLKQISNSCLLAPGTADQLGRIDDEVSRGLGLSSSHHACSLRRLTKDARALYEFRTHLRPLLLLANRKTLHGGRESGSSVSIVEDTGMHLPAVEVSSIYGTRMHQLGYVC